MTVSRLCGEGCPAPPWGWGLAYVQWERDVAVFFPIPLNLLARWSRQLRWTWDRWRGRPPGVDRRVRAIIARRIGRAQASSYQQGYEWGMRHAQTLRQLEGKGSWTE